MIDVPRVALELGGVAFYIRLVWRLVSHLWRLAKGE